MKLLVMALLLCLSSSAAQAAEDNTFRYDPTREVAAVGAGALVWGGLALFQDAMAPSRCWWCEVNGADSAVRDAARWEHPGTANVLSYITATAGPVAALGLGTMAAMSQGRSETAWVDLLIVSEAVVAAGVVNQTAKLLAERERPYARAGGAVDGSADSHLSFYSGHTSLAFSAAVAAGTVASLRKYRLAPWIWAAGLTAAAATAYLRIAADKHYFTDVLTGAVVGSGAGLTVPWLHRTSPSRDKLRLSLAIAPGWLALGAQW